MHIYKYSLIIIIVLTLIDCSKKKNLIKISKNIIKISDIALVNNWHIYSGEKSRIKIVKDEKNKITGNGSLKVFFYVRDWGSIRYNFTKLENLSRHKSIYMILKGDGSNISAKIEIDDNYGERFDQLFTVDWRGWKEIEFPLASFERRKDWQPEGVPNDGLTLTKVGAINIYFLGGVATWNIDTIGFVPKKIKSPFKKRVNPRRNKNRR
jgi:hypothetical protein